MPDKKLSAAIEAENFVREIIAEVADQELLHTYDYEPPEIPACVMDAYRATTEK